MNNGLSYVYTGNVHDEKGGSTYCQKCGETLIGRDWYVLTAWNLDEKGACRSCGEPAEPLPFFTHRRVPLVVLGKRADHTLLSLSPAAPRWVTVHQGDRGVCYHEKALSEVEVTS